jgi:chromosome segregation ATPase
MKDMQAKMKIKTSKLFLVFLVFIFLNTQVFCEQLIVEEDVTKKPKPVDTNVSVTSSQTDAKIKSIQNSISELKIKMEELSQSLKDAQTEIKTMQENMGKMADTDNSVLKELNKYNEQIQIIDNNYNQQVKKINTLDSDFKEIKDTLKLRVDKMQSWDDILDVLKKEISNNEIEIARLKKEISELKKQYGYSDNIFNSIAMWPYTGITALIISVIAFVVAVARQ